MGDLTPLAFDIETTGIGPDARLTVVGIDAPPGAWLVLQTGGRDADATALERTLADRDTRGPEVVVVDGERALLDALVKVVETRTDPEGHYLVAYNGERWNGGFDLPLLRRRCLAHDAAWPFVALAYVDVLDVVERIETGDASDLVTVSTSSSAGIGAARSAIVTGPSRRGRTARGPTCSRTTSPTSVARGNSPSSPSGTSPGRIST